MSFRQFGGLNYAPKHNIVASNYNTINELFLTETQEPLSINKGLYIGNNTNSNSVLLTSDINTNNQLDISGNLNISGALVVDNNQTNIGQFSNDNTFIGYPTGYQTTGSNNTAFGYNVGVDSTALTISNTIAIGSNVTTTNEYDIVLGTSSSNFVKFSNSGNGYQLSTDLSGNSNFTIASGNAIIIQANGLNIITGEAVQIQSGLNGGALQIQDYNTGTKPSTSSGYGNFASIGGVPYYYSPTNNTWNQLAYA